MSTITGSGLGSKAIKTFALLDQIVAVLGTTKLSFWPLLEGMGGLVHAYGTGTNAVQQLQSRDGAGAVALEAEFGPHQHPGGVWSYFFDSGGNLHLTGSGAAYWSFEGDDPFSCGAWVMMYEAVGNVRSIIAKYGSTANLEEYDFRLDASGQLELELHDASASGDETATGDTALTPYTWQFCVATYDGAQAAPDVHLYLNGTDTNATGATTENNPYAEMEDTAADLLIGARDADGTPAQELEGRMALPFITGKVLTAADVATLNGLGRTLLGL